MTELELMRKKIDEIDEKLLVLFKERLEVSKQIGILKKKYKMNIFDPEREKQIISTLYEKNYYRTCAAACCSANGTDQAP